MNNLNFTAIDFETANNFRHSICQIGLCRVENGKTVYSGSFLIQPPENKYSVWNIGIHGISPDQTLDKPFFCEVWNEIKIHFDNQLIVAHNSAFDLDCLYKTLDYYKLEFPVIRSECTYKLSGLNLIDMAEALEITLMSHHDALNDSIMCAESYIRMKNGQKLDLQKITKKIPKTLFAGHERICGQVLQPDLENADCTSPFYNKKIVFTGILDKIGREEAAGIVKKMGADIDTTISKKTDFVIVGIGAGPSKLKKINENNIAGSNIKMVYEVEFLEMVNQWR